MRRESRASERAGSARENVKSLGAKATWSIIVRAEDKAFVCRPKGYMTFRV